MGRAFAVQTAVALDNSSLLADLQRSLNELHRTQEELVKTARFSTLAALAGALAHQVNNPLTTVILNTQLLLSAEGVDENQQEMLEAIVRAGKRASSVVKRLLFSANPNARTLTPEPINVGYTIIETVSLLQSQHRGDRAILHHDASAADDCFVMALPGELEDVWLNLLTNARDAVQSQENPNYGISTSIDPDSKTLEVTVWDNGVGIEMSMLTAVFEPFVTTKAEGAGTGLGLFICKQIVEQVSGSLTIESQVGSGTRVIVRLPITSLTNDHLGTIV